MIKIKTSYTINSVEKKLEIKYFLGKRYLKTEYNEYVHYLTKFFNKFAFGWAWALEKGDWWYENTPKDKGLLWYEKRKMDIEEGKEKYVSVLFIYIGRLRLDFGIQKFYIDTRL